MTRKILYIALGSALLFGAVALKSEAQGRREDQKNTTTTTTTQQTPGGTYTTQTSTTTSPYDHDLSSGTTAPVNSGSPGGMGPTNPGY